MHTDTHTGDHMTSCTSPQMYTALDAIHTHTHRQKHTQTHIQMITGHHVTSPQMYTELDAVHTHAHRHTQRHTYR